MSLENVGLGGVLTFSDQAAVTGMDRASRSADKLSKSFTKVSTIGKILTGGMDQLGTSLRRIGFAGLPITAALGLGFNQAVKFEKQMSAVEAITGATAEQMEQVSLKSKRMGATTIFTASQMGKGFEYLSRAGFNVEEQLGSIGGVANAAAADEIGLAKSTRIIASTMRALGMPITDVTTGMNNAMRTADVLALASARSMTDMIGMGEAMRYAAGTSRDLKIDLETTAALLGAAGDAGLYGSIGGTSYTQALNKLLRPSRKGAAYLNQMRIRMNQTAEGGLDIVDVFKQIHEGLSGVASVTQKGAMVAEIFGIRGKKAFTAFSNAIESGKLDSLLAQLYEAQGAAERMAKTRLNNFAGQIVLLKSAAEGFAIEVGGLFLGPLTSGVKDFVTHLQNVVIVLQELNTEAGLTQETINKVGNTTVQIARGIREGVEDIVNTWEKLRAKIYDVLGLFVDIQSPDTVRQFVRMATAITIVAGVLAPVMIVLGGMVFLITSAIIPAFAAMGSMVASIFSGPVLLAIGAGILAFSSLKDKGGSIIGMLEKLKDDVDKNKDSMIGLGSAITTAFGGSNLAALGTFGTTFSLLKRDGESIRETFERVWDEADQGLPVIATIGAVIAGVFGGPVTASVLGLGAAFLFIRKQGESVSQTFSKIWNFIEPLLPLFAAIGTVVATVFTGPVGAAIGLLVTGFTMIRGEGESLSTTFSRIWGVIKQGFDFLMENVFGPFVYAIKVFPNVFGWARDEIGDSLNSIGSHFGKIIRTIIQILKGLAPVFKFVFTVIGVAVSLTASIITTVFVGAIKYVEFLITKFSSVALSLAESVVNIVKWTSEYLGKAFVAFGSEDIGKGLIEFGKGHFEFGAIDKKELPEKISETKIRQEVKKEKQKEADLDKVADKVTNAINRAQPKELTVNNKMCVDGKIVARAVNRHKMEVYERAGFKATPWQKRAGVEHGAVPVGGS